MKNIVKIFARWILEEELNDGIKRREEANRKYKSELDGLLYDRTVLEKENHNLKMAIASNRRVIISKPMLECIVKMLPDANAVARGDIKPEDLNLRTMRFVEIMDGQEFIHELRFVKTIGNEIEEIKGLTINISNYNINVFIPLRREKVKYEIYSVRTEIDTYFWDFYMSGILMLSSEAWDLSTSFIRAQRNVLSDFKEAGLL